MQHFILDGKRVKPYHYRLFKEKGVFQTVPLPERVKIVLFHPYENILGFPVVKAGDSVVEGQVIGMRESFCFHASISGTVKNVGKENIQILNDVQEVPFVEIEFKGQFINWENKKHSYDNLTKQSIYKNLQQNGVVNLAYQPWFSLREIFKHSWDTLVINALNLDPFTNVNSMLILYQWEAISESIKILQKCFSYTKIILIVDHRVAFFLKKKSLSENIKLVVVKESFPSCDERILLKQYLNIGINSSKDLLALKMCVLNPTTLKVIYQSVVYNKPLISQDTMIYSDFFYYSGIYNVRFGSLLKDTFDNFEFKASIEALSTGSFFSRITYNNISVPFMSFMLNIHVLEKKEIRETITKKSISEECIQCAECEKYCPVGIVPSFILEKEGGAFDTTQCSLCGLCEYVCVANIPLLKLLKQKKIKEGENGE